MTLRRSLLMALCLPALLLSACAGQPVGETLPEIPSPVMTLPEVPSPTVTLPQVPVPQTEAAAFDPRDIPMRAVDSSCFSAIGYDTEHAVLKVTFRDSGKTYLYYRFPDHEWESFTSAESLGQWYNENIKPEYDYELCEP